MSIPVCLEETQERLRDLVAHLAPGDDVLFTLDDLRVVNLVSSRLPRQPRQPGNCKGMLTIVSDDEHLKDFAEYMP